MDAATVCWGPRKSISGFRWGPRKSVTTRIRQTNDLITGMKAAATRVGYFNDSFLNLISSLSISRYDAINTPWCVRFAYVRMICMDHILRKFIEETQHGGQIISFGAGFDTAYFRLKEALGRDICFVEVDLPKVVCEKIEIIQATPNMSYLLKTCDINIKEATLKSSDYHLFGFNLNNTSELLLKLLELGIDPSRPTLILTEFVLPYMDSQSSSDFIKWSSESFPHSLHLSHGVTHSAEEITKTLQYFQAKHGSTWNIDCPTPDTVVKQFKDLGWEESFVHNLPCYYYKIKDFGERQRVRQVCFFDEYENAALVSQAFFLAFSAKGKLLSLLQKLRSSDVNTCKCNLKSIASSQKSAVLNRVYHVEKSDVNTDYALKLTCRNGHATVALQENNDYLMYGGKCGEDFLMDSLVHVSIKGTKDSIPVHETTECSASGQSPGRIAYSSLVKSGKDEFILYGGYDEDCEANSDIFVLKEMEPKKYLWSMPTLNGTIPSARWRHTAAVIMDKKGKALMIVYGGKDGFGDALGDCYILALEPFQWHRCALSGDIPDASHSHGSAVWKGSLLLYGGLDCDEKPINKLYKLSLAEAEHQIDCHLFNFCSPLPARYTPSCMVKEDSLIIVGGVEWKLGSPEIFVVDLCNGLTSNYKINVQLPTEPVLIYGMSCNIIQDHAPNRIKKSTEIFIFGGGGYINPYDEEVLFTKPSIIFLEL